MKRRHFFPVDLEIGTQELLGTVLKCPKCGQPGSYWDYGKKRVSYVHHYSQDNFATYVTDSCEVDRPAPSFPYEPVPQIKSESFSPQPYDGITFFDFEHLRHAVIGYVSMRNETPIRVEAYKGIITITQSFDVTKE